MKSKIIITGMLMLSTTALMLTQNAPSSMADTVNKPVFSEKNSTKSISNSDLYQQLDELRSENAILTESLKNTELKNKINTVGVDKASEPSNMPPVLSANNPGSMFQLPSAPSTQVQMVSGTDNKLTALISLPDGGTVSAHVGTDIPGVGTVKSISLNEVTVTHKKQTVILPFAGESGRIH